jgi:hypothetical protein
MYILSHQQIDGVGGERDATLVRALAVAGSIGFLASQNASPFVLCFVPIRCAGEQSQRKRRVLSDMPTNAGGLPGGSAPCKGHNRRGLAGCHNRSAPARRSTRTDASHPKTGRDAGNDEPARAGPHQTEPVTSVQHTAR